MLIAGAEGVADGFLPIDPWAVTNPDLVTLCPVGMDASLMAWLHRPDSVPETLVIPTLRRAATPAPSPDLPLAV